MNKIQPATKKIILVDGSSYLYRAFHALPNLMNSKRQPTGAVYGIVNMLKQLIREYDPEYMAVIFDAPGKTFRDELYHDYKANRSRMPDELRTQVQWVKQVIEAMGLVYISVEGVEADDVIGTLVQQSNVDNLPVLVCTGDKDLMQLVNDSTKVSDSMKGVIYDAQGVKEKLGVYPDQVIDYLTLVGDTADNIPGVAKVGPKTASKWLDSYRSLQNLLAHAHEIKGKVGDNLRDSLDTIDLSRKLATIKTDVELKLGINDLTIANADEEKLKEIYKNLEFKTWLSALGGASEKELTFNRDNTQIIFTINQLENWIERIKQAEIISLDTETTSLDVLEAQLVGISMFDGEKAVYIPVAHHYENAPQQLDLKVVLQHLAPVIEADKPKKILQNLKYDLAIFRNYGIDISNAQFDTMLESYVIDSTATRHDMDTLALKYLGYKTVHFEDIAGKGKSQLRFDDIDIDIAAAYAGEDAAITFQLHEKLMPMLSKSKTIQTVFETIEMPLVRVLEDIERNGVGINIDKLNAQSIQLSKGLDELKAQAYDCAGVEFNLASPKQIQEILFEKQQLPILKKTPKGQPSTAEDVLVELANSYPLPKLILQFRSLSKLKSTYTDKLPNIVNPRTGRIHTSYHQAVAATGRLSSSDPNLQNIPIRTAEGRKIREAFESAPGSLLLAADYSQIELRIMAHLSKDERLLSAFENGEDVHQATASEVFSTPLIEVSDDQRRSAKAINFGLIYGMSSYGLSQQLGITRPQADDYIQRYFDRYPSVKAYMDETRLKAHDIGYVETIFGRRLYLPEINSQNFNRRQYAERTAINAPMQGSAADIIKMAMIKTHEQLPKICKDSKMIMQVHDELVLEVPETSIEPVKSLIIELMTNAATLAVPLVVSTGIAENWALAH